MQFQPVKGTRDFYPDEMALRNWLVGKWREVSVRNGFVEYDGPVMEYLDLFRVKSGDEIVSQLFSLTDRGGRELALRPEITPTLARMVNARINSLPRPIKWFSIPRLFRAENPQKGRQREFLQWNVDVIGSDDEIADAECIFTCVDFLREVDLAPSEVVVRIGSRPLTMAVLAAVGVVPENMDAALAVLDKREKVPPEAFAEMAAGVGIDAAELVKVCAFQDAEDLEAVAALLGSGGDVGEDIRKLEAVLTYLDLMGAGEYCRLDLRIVRGLAYYTGVVYEVFDAAGELRAIAGGGRYDNLLEVLGGPAVGATGFGMGAPVVSILLDEKGKLPDFAARLDCFFIDEAAELFGQVLGEVGALRRRGLSVGYSPRRQSVGKQLKQANRAKASYAAILKDEGDTVALKHLVSGKQVILSTADFDRTCGIDREGTLRNWEARIEAEGS